MAGPDPATECDEATSRLPRARPRWMSWL